MANNSDFKFGAKLKLFNEHEVNIQPNPDHPYLIEYHERPGFPITRKKIAEKLKITNPTIKRMIPKNTNVTDFVVNRITKQVEVGIVINPGDDFILNRYKDILSVEEVSMYYEYHPEKGHNLDVEVDGHLDKEKLNKKVAETVADVVLDSHSNPDSNTTDNKEK